MRGQDAVLWIRGQCEMHGDQFGVNYALDGAVEVRVNDRFVFGHRRGENMNFDAGVIVDAYEAAASHPLPKREANPNDPLWFNELPQLPALEIGRLDAGRLEVVYPTPPDEADGRFAMEGVWAREDEYARQALPEPEIGSGQIVFNGEGDLKDVRAESKIKINLVSKIKINLVKDREGKVADSWIQSWDTFSSTVPSVWGTASTVPLQTYDQYGQLVSKVKLALCKLNKHYIAEGVEFCERCCWNCQGVDEAPFCTSCRKTMRAEQKEGESMRSFASEHFPSLVPFLD